MSGKGNRALLLIAVLLAVLALPVRLFAAGARFSACLLLLAAGLLLVLWVLNLLRARSPRVKLWRRIRLGYLILIAAGVVLFLVTESMVVYHAQSDLTTEPDCVIVLGGGLYGTEPSPILKTRLDAAIAYLERWPGKPVIVSGGQGENEVVPEAEVMQKYLERHGLPAAQIYAEDQSARTEENILFSGRLMEELGLDPQTCTVAIITSDFHLCRAKLLAVSDGMHPVGVSAETPWFYLRVNYYAREAFGVVWEFTEPSR
jgi:uncharacterized SAM-binding protein YcdF (DUF218 family)